ncbi:MAG: TIGR03621 family F420-dependent LLM class oxidoreductase [Chloroflexia bacterium]|nr:TIGR03621 family F420-dependent LLM class oxidoreductase [Chloroflexia bacterium]
MTHQRPFRFGVQVAQASSGQEWQETARKVEANGYDRLLLPDHIVGGQLAFGPALMLAAAATTTLRVGTLTLDNDFRHPALVASEAATLDFLSDGRFELGIGAGWMLEDYEKSGIPFDPPGVRVKRFEESVGIIKRLLSGEVVDFDGDYYKITDLEGFPKPVQQPRPPILFGAGGKRMLKFAAREADIVGLAPPAAPQGGIELKIDAASVENQVEYLREQAGERAGALEIQMLNQYLAFTDDPQSTAQDLSERWELPAGTVLESPHIIIGTVDSVVEKLIAERERFGISYVVVRGPAMEDFAPVVARLSGS